MINMSKDISVVVTGVGVVAPNGRNAKEFFQNCINGVTGISKSPIMKDFDYMSEYVGEVLLDDQLRWESKFKFIGEQACNEMLQDADLDREDIQKFGRRAVFSMASANVGSLRIESQLRKKNGLDSTGITYELNEYMKSDYSILDFNSSDCFYHFSDLMGIEGNTISINAACASGTLAIGEAVKMIKAGRADLAVAAGIDILSDLSLAGFNSLSNLSKSPCKPFDKNRDGITIGEGAVFLMLEREDLAIQRGAEIYGRIFGYSSMNEAYHVTAPDPSGNGAYYCMKKVLENREVSNEESLYINTHGTATQANDSMEVKAMELLGNNYNIAHLWFSSTKSMIGHCLGASGSLEFACSLIGLKEGYIPVSISIDDPIEYDEEKMTLVTDKSKSRPYDLFISNSYAFAGNMASIGVEKV